MTWQNEIKREQAVASRYAWCVTLITVFSFVVAIVLAGRP